VQHDLAVIVVSTNEAHWLRPCLSSVFAHGTDLTLDVIVADNRSVDGTRELVESEFPTARVVTCENHGFGHANNRALETTRSRYVLFLNPDTEILEGTFGRLVAMLDDRPSVGLVGVKQLDADGDLFPTIRRFPTVSRYAFEAIASERFPFHADWLGERELDLVLYERDLSCDWTSGSFMLTRRSALDSAGWFDERFFLFSEEVDLCARIRAAGWEIRHVPAMTIRHHFNKVGTSPRMVAQDAFSRMQYMRKHFTPERRAVSTGALLLRHGLRALPVGRDLVRTRERRSAARAALRVLLGRDEPPFGEPPSTALRSPAAASSATFAPEPATRRGERAPTRGADALASPRRRAPTDA
jgi:GT2 family glycosyltransferase